MGTPTPEAFKKTLQKMDGNYTIKFHENKWAKYFNKEVEYFNKEVEYFDEEDVDWS